MALQPFPETKENAYLNDPENIRNLSTKGVSVSLDVISSLSSTALPLEVTVEYPDRSDLVISGSTDVTKPSYWNYLEIQVVQTTPRVDTVQKTSNGAYVQLLPSNFYLPNGTPSSLTEAPSEGNWTALTKITPTDSGTSLTYSFNVPKESWLSWTSELLGGTGQNKATSNTNIKSPSKYWNAVVFIRARVVCIKEWSKDVADSYVSAGDDDKKLILALGPWGYVPSPQQAVSVTSDPTNKQNTSTEDTADAEASDLPASNVSMTKLRTNLPIAKNATASLSNPSGLGTVNWRHGLIHTWENTPADGAFPDQIPYGFRFHYNPASWAQSVSFTENINADALAASQMDRLPLPGGFASISFSLFLNRIVDLAMVGDIYKLGIPPAPNGVIADPNSPPPDAQAIASLANTMSTMYDEARQGVGVPSSMVGYVSNLGKTEHIQRIIRQGTLYDLDFLYASANGRALGSFHVHGPGVTNPSYIGDGWLPSDYGYIAPRFVRVWLGPYITFVGRINNIDVQHLLFTQYMVPTFTQVNITMTRGLTFGKDTADAKTLFNSNSSALGIANTSTEGNQTSTGTVGQ